MTPRTSFRARLFPNGAYGPWQTYDTPEDAAYEFAAEEIRGEIPDVGIAINVWCYDDTVLEFHVLPHCVAVRSCSSESHADEDPFLPADIAMVCAAESHNDVELSHLIEKNSHEYEAMCQLVDARYGIDTCYPGAVTRDRLVRLSRRVLGPRNIKGSTNRNLIVRLWAYIQNERG